MRSTRPLLAIRTVHTVIYVLMASAVLYVFTAGLLGFFNGVVVLALLVVGIEVIIFTMNGCMCPLTALAIRYGATKGYAFETWLPEKATRFTFRFFGVVLALGLLLLLGRLFISLPD